MAKNVARRLLFVTPAPELKRNSRPALCSFMRVRCPIPTGSPGSLSVTRKVMSLPASISRVMERSRVDGRSSAIRIFSNRAYPEFLLRAMFAIARAKASPRAWAKGRWRSNSFTNTSLPLKLMDAESLKLVRALPLFSSLSDDDLGCLKGGEIFEYKEGDLVAVSGDPCKYFYVTVEGEIAIHRTYDHPAGLIGVSRPANFMGEMFILLEMPWISTARASKPTRIFQMQPEDFWRMLGTCRTVAREVLRTASTRLRNIEGYS